MQNSAARSEGGLVRVCLRTWSKTDRTFRPPTCRPACHPRVRKRLSHSSHSSLKRRPAEAKPRNAHRTSTPLSHPTVTICISYFEQFAVRELLAKQGTAQHNIIKHNQTTKQQNNKITKQQNTAKHNRTPHNATPHTTAQQNTPTEPEWVNGTVPNQPYWTEREASRVGSGLVEKREWGGGGKGRRIGSSKISRYCANIER